MVICHIYVLNPNMLYFRFSQKKYWYSQLKDHQGLTSHLVFLGTVAHTSTSFVEFQILHHTQHYLHIDHCECHNWFGIGLLLQNVKQIRWYLYLHHPLQYIKGYFEYVLHFLHLIFHFCTIKVVGDISSPILSFYEKTKRSWIYPIWTKEGEIFYSSNAAFLLILKQNHSYLMLELLRHLKQLISLLFYSFSFLWEIWSVQATNDFCQWNVYFSRCFSKMTFDDCDLLSGSIDFPTPLGVASISWI